MAKTKIKRPRITRDVERTIVTLYRNDLNAKQIFDMRKKEGHKAPSLRSIQTIVVKAKDVENTPEFQKLAQPWHLGLLREYPQLSAEAVRHIDEVQRAMRSFFENVSVNPDDYHINVRQALWVARLYDLVRKHIETDDFYREHFKNTDHDDPRVLLSVAFKYADYELLCDLANIPFDTSELDSALSHGLHQFYDFVSKQQAQPLREGDIIPVYKVHEEHKQPHKMNKDGDFVFDSDCQACRDREVSGRWFDLRKSAFERRRSKKISKNNKKGGTK